MSEGVDYAWARPSPQGLYNLGYRFACRYLSWLPNGKVIDAAERDSLLAAGLDIALNWEFAAGDQRGGAGAGATHATEAVRQAKALGYPAGSAIYFSADWDVSAAEWGSTVAAYQRAARAVCNAAAYRFGVYGGYNVVKWSFDGGIAQDGWQTYAWSGGRWDARATLRQVQNGVSILGSDCDRNTATGQTYFWKHAAGAAVGGNDVGSIDDDMTNLVRVQINNAEHYLQALVGLKDAGLIGDTVHTNGVVTNALAALLRQIATDAAAARADVAAVKARPVFDVSTLAGDPAFRAAIAALVAAAVKAEVRDAVADLGEGGAAKVRAES